MQSKIKKIDDLPLTVNGADGTWYFFEKNNPSKIPKNLIICHSL